MTLEKEFFNLSYIREQPRLVPLPEWAQRDSSPVNPITTGTFVRVKETPNYVTSNAGRFGVVVGTSPYKKDTSKGYHIAFADKTQEYLLHEDLQTRQTTFGPKIQEFSHNDLINALIEQHTKTIIFGNKILLVIE